MLNGQSFEAHDCSLQFYVTCQTQIGDELRICGNSRSTGYWNPIMGHKLFTDQSLYPVWKSVTPLLLKNTEKLFFKTCIINQSGFRWQSKISDREVQIQRHSIIKMNFNERGERKVQKSVKQIQCREGTFDIIDELSSSQESSIEFKTNYPIEDFFHHDQKLRNDRKLSTGISSNLFSGNDENDYLAQNQQNYQSNFTDNKMFQSDIDPFKSPEFNKAQSICTVSKLPTEQSQDSEYLRVSQIRVGKRSQSRSSQKSQSEGKSRIEEAKSSFMIKVPPMCRGKSGRNQRENIIKDQNSVKNQLITKQKRVQMTKNKSSSDKDTYSNNSNLIQYDTQDEYLDNRESDVATNFPHEAANNFFLNDQFDQFLSSDVQF